LATPCADFCARGSKTIGSVRREKTEPAGKKPSVSGCQNKSVQPFTVQNWTNCVGGIPHNRGGPRTGLSRKRLGGNRGGLKMKHKVVCPQPAEKKSRWATCSGGAMRGEKRGRSQKKSEQKEVEKNKQQTRTRLATNSGTRKDQNFTHGGRERFSFQKPSGSIARNLGGKRKTQGGKERA